MLLACFVNLFASIFLNTIFLVVNLYFCSDFGSCLALLDIELRGIYPFYEAKAADPQTNVKHCPSMCNDGEHKWMTPQGLNEIECIQSVLQHGRTAGVAFSVNAMEQITVQDFLPSYAWGDFIRRYNRPGPYCAVIKADKPYAYEFGDCSFEFAHVCACQGKQFLMVFRITSSLGLIFSHVCSIGQNVSLPHLVHAISLQIAPDFPSALTVLHVSVFLSISLSRCLLWLFPLEALAVPFLLQLNLAGKIVKRICQPTVCSRRTRLHGQRPKWCVIVMEAPWQCRSQGTTTRAYTNWPTVSRKMLGWGWPASWWRLSYPTSGTRTERLWATFPTGPRRARQTSRHIRAWKLQRTGRTILLSGE